MGTLVYCWWVCECQGAEINSSGSFFFYFMSLYFYIYICIFAAILYLNDTCVYVIYSGDMVARNH